MRLDADSHRLSDDEHRTVFEQDIKPDLFAQAKASNRPVAVIFGGQPGAGKSAAVDAAMRELEQDCGAVQIIGDDLRGYHPQYARLLSDDDRTAAFYTDRDTGGWIENAIDEAKGLSVNIVVEGTMRDADKVADTMRKLRSAGYSIDARALAVNQLFSMQGILQRYENQKADRGFGRMTTREAHRAAFDGMPTTLERIERGKLADRIAIYRRGAEVIYTNNLASGDWIEEPQARTVLEAERSRSMTLVELQIYAKAFDRLLELVTRPERGASAEEIASMNHLSLRARTSFVVAALKHGEPNLEQESMHLLDRYRRDMPPS